MSGKVLLILLGVFCLAVYQTSAQDPSTPAPTPEPEGDNDEAQIVGEEGRNIFLFLRPYSQADFSHRGFHG